MKPTVYCRNCGRETIADRKMVPFEYPESDYDSGKLKAILASECCGDEITHTPPILHCPVDGCTEEMDRVDDEWCECPTHGQLLIYEVLYMNNDMGLDPYKRRT